jgi:hypothetical protein
MSLINVRRERKKGGSGVTRPPSLYKLIILAVIVGALIWYLSRYS